MAQYKVLQDIEAEDKLLGPLSLRQFIYAAITIAFGFVAFRLFMTSVWFLGFAFVPPALFFGLLAAPLGGQQSSEIWLLAKIRFFFKPRRRIWDQDGLQELVTITVPKKIEKQLTKGYSNDEVKSRLKTLAVTLDTRGWAVKNVTENLYQADGSGSDRLLQVSQTLQPSIQTEQTVDMLDPTANPRAQSMDQMIAKASAEHRDAIESSLQRAKAEQSNTAKRAITSTPTIDEQEILQQLHQKEQAESLSMGHLRTVQPLSQPGPQQRQEVVTPKADPAIINLVENSKDLSVQTLAGQANRIKDQGPEDEVVISLH